MEPAKAPTPYGRYQYWAGKNLQPSIPADVRIARNLRRSVSSKASVAQREPRSADGPAQAAHGNRAASQESTAPQPNRRTRRLL